MRDQKTIGSANTYFLYDGDTLLEEMTASGSTPTLTEMYQTGADGLRARWDPNNSDNETDVYSYDPQGSVCEFQVTESANPDQRTLLYDAWGYLVGDILYLHGTPQAPFGGQGFGGRTGITPPQKIKIGEFHIRKCVAA